MPWTYSTDATGGILTQADEATQSVTAVVDAGSNQLNLTITAHGYAIDDLVTLSSISPYDGRYLVVAVPDANTITISDTDIRGIQNVFTGTATGNIARGDKDKSGQIGLTGVTNETSGEVDINDVTVNRIVINGALLLCRDGVFEQIIFREPANHDEHKILITGTGFLQLGVKANDIKSYRNNYGFAAIKEDAITTGDQQPWVNDGQGNVGTRTAFYAQAGGEFNMFGQTLSLSGSFSLHPDSICRIEDSTIYAYHFYIYSTTCHVIRPEFYSKAGNWSLVTNFLTFDSVGGTMATNTYLGGSAATPTGTIIIANVPKLLEGQAIIGGGRTTASPAVLMDFLDMFEGSNYSIVSTSGRHQTGQFRGRFTIDAKTADGTPLEAKTFYIGAAGTGVVMSHTGVSAEQSFILRSYVQAGGTSLASDIRYDKNQDATDIVDVVTFVYGYTARDLSIELKGNGLKTFEAKPSVDLLITETDPLIVAAYTTYNTAQRVYDALTLLHYDNIVDGTLSPWGRQGNQVIINDKNIIFDSTAPATPTYIGTTATLNATTYTGGIIATSGEISQLNGALFSNLVLDGGNWFIGQNILTGSATSSSTLTIASAGTYDATGFIFDASTTLDNTSGGPIDVIINTGQQQPVVSGSTVNFLNAGAQLTFNNLDQANVQIHDQTGAVVNRQTNLTGQYIYSTPDGSSGTWCYIVKRVGYAAIRGEYVADGGDVVVNSTLTQKTLANGSIAYTGTSSVFLNVTINPDGSDVKLRIGNGAVSAVDIFNEFEDALATQDGMSHLCQTFTGVLSYEQFPTGTFVILGDNILFIRDTAGDSNASVNAIVQSKTGTFIDEINGSVDFITATKAQQLIEYGGFIFIDVDNGTDSTVYPFGTQSTPVKTWAQAKTLADFYGLKNIKFTGTLLHTSDSVGYWFEGSDAGAILVLQGFDISKTTFRNLILTGDAGNPSQGTQLRQSYADNILNWNGVFDEVIITGPISLTGERNYLTRCSSAVVDDEMVILTVNRLGQCTVTIRDWYGRLTIGGVSDALNTVSLDSDSGDIELLNTNTAGNIVIRGEVTSFTDNSAGSVVSTEFVALQQDLLDVKTKTDQLTFTTPNILDATAVTVQDKDDYTLTIADKDDIVDRTWDEAYADHTTAGTFGKLMDNLRKANLALDGSVTANPTTSSFDTDIADPTGTHNEQVILFVSGALAGQSKPILTFTNGVSNTIVLQESLTQAPSVSDEFVILPHHIHSLTEIKAQADQALIDYDGPTRAEATEDKDQIITEVNANEIKIDGVKAKTDQLTFTSGNVHARTQAMQDAVITSAKFAAGAINSTVAPNLNATVSSRATPANITAARDVILSDLTNIKGSGFNNTTDSLEAIRDRGDAAWTTGGGGDTAADIYTYFTDLNREDAFKADVAQNATSAEIQELKDNQVVINTGIKKVSFIQPHPDDIPNA